MNFRNLVVIGLFATLANYVQTENANEPTVFVTLLVRNKRHTLPYFLKLFEELKYPKEKMILW